MIRFLLVVLVGISFAGFSQNTKVKFFDKLASSKYISDGSEMYNVGRTSDALMFFRQAKVKNPTNWKAYFWLATTEFELNSYDQALMNASKALELTKEKSDGELQLLLGKINHKLNMIESAITHFKNAKMDFGDKLAADYDIPIYIAQCEFALNEQKNGVQNKRIAFSSKLNTKYDEYAPILIDGGKQLFFTARNSETTGGNLNPEDQRFFEDMYHAVWDATNGEWVLNVETFDGINTEGFDALSFVSRDGLYGLGTVNTSASKEKTTTSSDIFEINTDIPGTWGGVEIIKNTGINNSFFDGSASITDTLYNEDETYSQTMYFVSDRTGDKTLTDIYSVEKKNGVWQTPKVLPKEINTNGRETTPFITPDGKYLFFSSDALPGMGGYDIYYSENLGATWGKPVNLGARFNTVNDDSHFQIYFSIKKAVLAGIEENEGVYNYDIFEVNVEGMDYPFLK